MGNLGFLRGSVLVDTVGRNLAKKLRYIKPDLLLKQEMLLRVSGILNQEDEHSIYMYLPLCLDTS